MAKKTSFICQECGATSPRWSGKCGGCGAWNSLLEEPVGSQLTTGSSRGAKPLETVSLAAVKPETKHRRLETNLREVDQVLGGGVVPGSMLLLAGEPGVGKSTLLLQVAAGIAQDTSVLYVSGEESLEQVKLRADRLKVSTDRLQLLTATDIDSIIATMLDDQPDFVIIDSIQTMRTEAVTSSAGTVSQITACTHLLQAAAKQTNTAIMVVGHVTKEGNIAGPKILEHLVDVVLYLEGERFGSFKLLRGIKNRFGATHEVGIFEMRDTGLVAVANPSAALLDERQQSDGSVVLATLEGTRALLVEVQALVSSSPFGYPKRTAAGFDLNRLNLLIAVLQQRAGVNLADKDVYINIVGGIKVNEPAADLAVAVAIASAAKRKPVKTDTVIFGEIGLSGEIRSVADAPKRCREAKKLKFKRAIGPKSKTQFIASAATLRDAIDQSLKP